METQSSEILALTRDHLVGIGPLVVGIVVVAMLIAALWLGLRTRKAEPGPSQEKQPRAGAWQRRQETDEEAAADDHGPGHQDSERHEHAESREPHEVPADGRRRLPYEIENQASRRSSDQERRQWDEGQSGSFGSG
ncbi:DUF6479 family protein [Streptomyces sp. B1866]|uniref:DUF6479 family protein n=1 Tax=Streptomyces sp. B1866 TaxID=3075431 RepID=UPI00288EF893|nr:DUF6479 family protein [Streptomyces sp. B1866]MDT3400688.1 DUF6479 family protein [Streptomyces sp. B1866]